MAIDSADKLSHGTDNRKGMRLPSLIGVILLEACSASKGAPPVDLSKINPRLLDGTRMAAEVDHDRRFEEHAISVKTGRVLSEAKSSGLGVDDVQRLNTDLIKMVFSTAFYKEHSREASPGVSAEEPSEKPVVDRSEQGIALRRASGKLHAVYYEAKISRFSAEEVRELVDTVLKEVYGEAEVAASNPTGKAAE